MIPDILYILYIFDFLATLRPISLSFRLLVLTIFSSQSVVSITGTLDSFHAWSGNCSESVAKLLEKDSHVRGYATFV